MTTSARLRLTLRILFIVTVGGILLLTVAAQPGSAQEGSPAVAMRSVRDGVYTAAQVDRGATTFAAGCSACHVPEQFADPLFMDAWTGSAVITGPGVPVGGITIDLGQAVLATARAYDVIEVRTPLTGGN